MIEGCFLARSLHSLKAPRSLRGRGGDTGTRRGFPWRSLRLCERMLLLFLVTHYLLLLHVFARGTSFSSRQFVALIQAAKVSRHQDRQGILVFTLCVLRALGGESFCSASGLASQPARRRDWWNSLRYPLETTRNKNDNGTGIRYDLHGRVYLEVLLRRLSSSSRSSGR